MGLARTVLAGVSASGALAAFLSVSAAVAWIGHAREDLPDHMEIARWEPSQGTTILASDGSLIGRHASENRTFVPLREIPPLVIDAFLAAEDKSYWSHSGVDPTAIVRAALANARSSSTRPEGGSTITQQVVKNVLLSSEQSMERKAREALLAVLADRDVGKERVLEVYLNEIYLGSGAYGVAAAADTYFGMELEELGLAEAALIAGLPKAPGAASPFVSPGRAAERRSYVLRRMAEEGMASEEEAAAAAASPLPSRRDTPPAGSGPEFWYAQEAVRRVLMSEQGSSAVYGRGGEVRTTFSPAVQAAAHHALRAGLARADRGFGWRGPLARDVPLPADWNSEALAPPPGAEDWKVAVVAEAGRDARLATREGEVVISGSSLDWAGASGSASRLLSTGDAVLVADFGSGPELVQVPAVQGALAVLDPRSGHVLALAGGFSAQTSEFDRSTQARRQTGSAFKPFIYLAAMEAGFDAMSPVMDAPISLEQEGRADWRPSGGSSGGMGLVTMRRSLELSRNLSTVRLLYDLGMDDVASTAARAGIPLPHGASWSAALGAAEHTVLQVAAGYAALANGGYRVDPSFFASRAYVEDEPSLDPVAVAQVSSMLEGVVTAGTARQAFAGYPHPVAAKTGTTNDARDAWLAAYGPAFVAVAWIGMDDMSPLPRGSTGGSLAAPVVRDFLDRAAGSLAFEPFLLPPGTSTVRAWRESGMPDPQGDVIEIVRER